MPVNSTQELIDDIRRGRMVVLADAEDRENEGDLVLAADFVTPDAINFMATHARGLICLTLTEERCRQLKLPLMVNDNRSPMGTAFTVSIEAASGVTTGPPMTAGDPPSIICVAGPASYPMTAIEPTSLPKGSAPPSFLRSTVPAAAIWVARARCAGLVTIASGSPVLG